MDVPNNEIEGDTRNIISCPNHSCLSIPQVDYNPDLFNFFIKCNNNRCNYKGYVDIDNYLNLPEKILRCAECSINILNHDKFNYCLNCKKFYDARCIFNNDPHRRNHQIYTFDYKKVYNYCLSHIKKYEFFCQNCRNSLCPECLINNNIHVDHTLIDLKDKSPSEQKSVQINNIIEEQLNLLNKVKIIVNKCINKLEDDIKIKILLLNNYLKRKRNLNSIYNFDSLSKILNVNKKYKNKIENIYNNDNGNENIDINYYINQMMSILYYYIMCQNFEKENEIKNIIKKEFNLNFNNNCISNAFNVNINCNKESNINKINSKIKKSKFKIKHLTKKSKTIKNISEDKIITSIARLESGNLVVGFKSGLIKVYDSQKLCTHFIGNEKEEEELLLINKFNHRTISYIYEIKKSTLLCSTYSKIYKIKLTNNDSSWEYLSKIILPSYEFCKRIIQIGKELIICLTQRNKKNSIECYIRIFKIKLDSILDYENEQEIGYLSDFEKDIYSAGEGEKGKEGLTSEISENDDYQSFNSGGKIDSQIELYKKNITNNTRYLCSIFPTKINFKENDEYLYEFIATSNDNITNGENKIYFYGINKTNDGHHRLIFNKIGEISQISCSSRVDSICKISNNKIGIAIQKYYDNNHEFAIVDCKKKELINIYGNNPINLFNISFDKNIFFCTTDFKEKQNKKDSCLIKYIKIKNKTINGIKCLEFEDSKGLLKYKHQFSHIIQLESNNQNINGANLFFCLISGYNIFIIKIYL